MASNITDSFVKEVVIHTCHLCDSTDNVNWYCNDCEDAMCDSCTNGHGRGRKTRNDDVVPIDKANVKSDNVVTEPCKQHPGNIQEMYCCDCDELLCTKCFSKSHKGHDWKPFEEIVPIKQQRLQEHMGSISSMLDQLQIGMSHKQREMEATSENYGNAGAEVNFQRNRIKAEIDAIADSVIDELLKIKKEESEKSKRYCEKRERKIEEMTQLIDQIETSSDSWDLRQFIEMNSRLKETLPKYDDDSDEEPLPKHISFYAGDIERRILGTMIGEVAPWEPTPDDEYQE